MKHCFIIFLFFGIVNGNKVTKCEACFDVAYEALDVLFELVSEVFPNDILI
jgi:hypothetical protein